MTCGTLMTTRHNRLTSVVRDDYRSVRPEQVASRLGLNAFCITKGFRFRRIIGTPLVGVLRTRTTSVS